MLVAVTPRTRHADHQVRVTAMLTLKRFIAGAALSATTLLPTAAAAKATWTEPRPGARLAA